jgi:hypothetical protein
MPLFIPQCHNGINAYGSMRRQEAGAHGDHNEQAGSRNQRCRIG